MQYICWPFLFFWSSSVLIEEILPHTQISHIFAKWLFSVDLRWSFACKNGKVLFNHIFRPHLPMIYRKLNRKLVAGYWSRKLILNNSWIRSHFPLKPIIDWVEPPCYLFEGQRLDAYQSRKSKPSPLCSRVKLSPLLFLEPFADLGTVIDPIFCHV